MEENKRVWKADEIKDMLRSNDRAVVRGIARIYELQTSAEQTAESTHNKNGVGFGAFDAPFLTSLAKQIKNGRTLTGNQLKFARPKMLKYAGQLARIANGEIREMKSALED